MTVFSPPASAAFTSPLSKEANGLELFDAASGAATSNYYCLSVLLPSRLAGQRFEIAGRLNAQGVGTSVYYPKAVPHLTYYRDKYRVAPSDFPVAQRISDSSIALPVGAHLDEADMAYIVEAMKAALAEQGR